jgi:hypothetical protein
LTVNKDSTGFAFEAWETIIFELTLVKTVNYPSRKGGGVLVYVLARCPLVRRTISDM